jgi:hypothetical protein
MMSENDSKNENEFKCFFLLDNISWRSVEEIEQHLQNCKICQSDLDFIWEYYQSGKSGKLDTHFSGFDLVPKGINDKTAFLRAWQVAAATVAAKYFEEGEFFEEQIYEKMQSPTGRDLIRQLLRRQAIFWIWMDFSVKPPNVIIRDQLSLISDSYKKVREYFGPATSERLFLIERGSYQHILEGIKALSSRFAEDVH